MVTARTSDFDFSYAKNRSLAELLVRRMIDRVRIRPYTLRTYGKVSGSTRS